MPRGISLSIFILSFISLLISLKLFWNMGIYAGKYGSSPVFVCGGRVNFTRFGGPLFLSPDKWYNKAVK